LRDFKSQWRGQGVIGVDPHRSIGSSIDLALAKAASRVVQPARPTPPLARTVTF